MKTLPLSIQYICICGEVRKLITGYSSYKEQWKYISFSQNIPAVSIALDKALFSTKNYLYFSYFMTKTYVVGTH